MFYDANASVRKLLHIAHGVAGVDRAPDFALDIPKAKRPINAPSNEPAALHSASRISRTHTLTALREV